MDDSRAGDQIVTMPTLDPRTLDPLCPPPEAEVSEVWTPALLEELYAEAVATCAAAVARAEEDTRRELAETGRRMAAEQERLYSHILDAMPTAVRGAAAKGQRVATILEFGGGDKLQDFCVLYMLKGPHAAEGRAEMKAMGVRPLLHRLRSVLTRAGFGVHHAWQRATNQNTLAVTW